MFIRNRKANVDLLGNERYSEVSTRTNLYPNAFPFSRALAGRPYPVAFVAIHGQAPAVDTNLTDVWGQNIIRTYPTAAFTVAVSSSSANDVNTSGSGAWKVEVDVLDTDYVTHTITLSLNGQTKVVDTSLVGNAFRINDVRVVDAGANFVNAGDIYVYDTTSAVTAGVPQDSTKIFHKILAGEVTGRGAFYTVPKGCKLQTQQVRAGITDAVNTNRSGTVTFKAYVMTGGKLIPTAYPITGQISSGLGLVEVSPDWALAFPEKTDIVLQAKCSAASVVAVYVDAVLFYA